MLDFFLIKDESPIPDHEIDFLLIAGCLGIKTFDQLQMKGIIDQSFGYYTDFRWKQLLIKQMRLKIVSGNHQHDTDVKQLLKLFDIAQQNDSGLIAFGD